MTDEARERAEALDPNTPVERLAELMEAHSDLVLQNPGLPLILLEHPDFWEELPKGLGEVAQSPHCPPSFATWALQRRKGRRICGFLATNQAMPLAVRRAAFLRTTGSYGWPEKRSSLSDFLSADELSFLDRGSTRDTVKAAEIEQLLALGSPGRRLAVDHPDCPPELLERIYRGDLYRDKALLHPHFPLTDSLLEHAMNSHNLHAALGMKLIPAPWARAFILEPELTIRAMLGGQATLTAAERQQLESDPQNPGDPRLRNELDSPAPLSAELRQVLTVIQRILTDRIVKSP